MAYGEFQMGPPPASYRPEEDKIGLTGGSKSSKGKASKDKASNNKASKDTSQAQESAKQTSAKPEASSAKPEQGKQKAGNAAAPAAAAASGKAAEKPSSFADLLAGGPITKPSAQSKSKPGGDVGLSIHTVTIVNIVRIA